LCGHFEAKTLEGTTVNLKDARIMKVLCDAYFLRSARQKAESRYRKALATQQAAEEDKQEGIPFSDDPERPD